MVHCSYFFPFLVHCLFCQWLICVTVFWGTMGNFFRVLKICVAIELLYCTIDNYAHALILSFIYPFFFLLQYKVVPQLVLETMQARIFTFGVHMKVYCCIVELRLGFIAHNLLVSPFFSLSLFHMLTSIFFRVFLEII